jgi:hypothetical protein
MRPAAGPIARGGSPAAGAPAITSSGGIRTCLPGLVPSQRGPFAAEPFDVDAVEQSSPTLRFRRAETAASLEEAHRLRRDVEESSDVTGEKNGSGP